MNNIKLECFCGTVKGSLDLDFTKKSFHIHCLCSDCQNYTRYLKVDDRILDEFGASELVQTYPRYLRITSGEDKVSCLRLTSKGMLRWYTSCCNTPIANTMDSYKIAFAGVFVKFMKFDNTKEKSQALGPVIMKSFGRDAIKEKPLGAHDTFPKLSIPRILKFLFMGYLKSMYKPSPFYKNKKLVVKPIVLSK